LGQGNIGQDFQAGRFFGIRTTFALPETDSSNIFAACCRSSVVQYVRTSDDYTESAL
jgi:hypothetical protein